MADRPRITLRTSIGDLKYDYLQPLPAWWIQWVSSNIYFYACLHALSIKLYFFVLQCVWSDTLLFLPSSSTSDDCLSIFRHCGCFAFHWRVYSASFKNMAIQKSRRCFVCLAHCLLQWMLLLDCLRIYDPCQCRSNCEFNYVILESFDINNEICFWAAKNA